MSRNRFGFVRVVGAVSAVVLSSALAVPAIAVATDADYVVQQQADIDPADAAAVQEFLGFLQTLPVMAHITDLTLADAADVAAATEAFGKLTDTQKTLVPTIVKVLLSAAQETIASLQQGIVVDPVDAAAAHEFVSSLIALPAIAHLDDLTLNDAADVKTAAENFEKLTDTQKAIVPTAIKAAIEAAQAKIAELEAALAKSMFRLYNPNSGEHFYTSDQAEHDNLVDLGWHDEGIGWVAPAVSETPVYRLYNAIGGEHHYTMDAEERDMLIEAGWTDEGIGWYSDDAQGVAILREYNPNQFANNHNYTSDQDEHDHLVELGWKDEGTAWYGLASLDQRR